MSGQAAEQLTLFREVSRASLFPWLESKKEKKTTVTYGRKCSELSENLRRVGLSVKTYLESCALPGEQFVRTWSVRDTLSPYLILKLRLSERRTEENECSLWPTATASDYFKGQLRSRQQMEGSRHSLDLPSAVQMWPTPKASDYKGSGPAGSKSAEHDRKAGNLKGVVMYATPQARDFRTGQNSRREDGNRSRNLNDQIGGQLNPTWVEWLMGFPLGWTDLNALETP